MTDKKQIPEEEQISRRDMLKLTGAALAVVGATQVVGLTSVLNKAQAASGGNDGSGHYWAMGIDINKCIGCKYCTFACQAVNDLPDDMIYNVVTEEKAPNDVKYYLSRPCMHCESAPCVHVCPVEATYHREDGIVEMDYDRCIGCRYCMVACPYDARVFNWEDHSEFENPNIPDFGIAEVEKRPRGVVEKCTFCSHRIDAGLERHLVPGIDAHATPACVVICPTGARVFGDQNDPESPITEFLAKVTTPLQLRGELSTNPNVIYNPPKGL